ncbi:MAG: RtcB family protein [Thermoleophilia bacterium]
MVEWLNELIYLYDSQELLLKRFRVTSLKETALRGIACAGLLKSSSMFEISPYCWEIPRTGKMLLPGGVGCGIACGMRLIRTNLLATDVRGTVPSLIQELSRRIPTGVGRHGDIRLNQQEMGHEIYDETAAKVYGFFKGQLCIMAH